MAHVKECRCGSHKPRYALYDAAGIFATFYCEDCYEEKKAKFDPAIFEPTSNYAATGNETDIRSEERW